MVETKYVPILKSKAGELSALKNTYDDVLNNFIPLVEILPEFAGSKTSVYAELKRSWRGNRMFVDVTLCETADSDIFENIHKELVEGLKIIPVIRMNQGQAVFQSAREIANVSRSGICLRVNSSELLTPEEIDCFLQREQFNRRQIILLVDFGYVVDETQYQKLIIQTNKLANLNDYDALVLSSGSTPRDLTGCPVGEDNYIERLDWQFWEKYQSTLEADFIFGDYATRHPDVLPPVKFRGSKSIRYTIKDKIAVLRGTRDDPFTVYLAQAATLCEYTDYFCGQEFSFGDKYLKEKCDNFNDGEGKSPGSATTWVTSAVNHHIAFVIKNDLCAVTTE